MPQYKYTARLINGKLVKGVMEAPSKEVLGKRLITDNIIPLEIIEFKSDIADYYLKLSRALGINKPALKDMSLLSRQFHALTRAGVPIVQSLLLLSDSTKNEILKLVLKEVLKDVESGHTLASAMRQHPNIFPQLMIALVDVGENTGSLEEVFAQMSSYFDREMETQRRVKEATRYPMIVIAVIGIAIIVINILVIPAFAQFFSKFGAELPLPTKILIATSYYMSHYWYVFIAGLIAVSFVWMTFIETPGGRMLWDRWKLKIPIIGSILQRALLARFVRAFALSMRAGVPLLETITVIAKTTVNVYVGEKILSMKHNIERGEALTLSAKKTEMFSPMVLQMMSIGEQSGDVERLLDEAGKFYEDDLDYDLKRLGQTIEPLLIFIVAGMVLVLALGVFLPMWDLSSVALSGQQR